MPHKRRNAVMLAFVLAFAALAVWTLVPADAAKRNDLGYYSACPFAPWSTLALLIAGGLIWAVRQYLAGIQARE
jgi:hypothetical protein